MQGGDAWCRGPSSCRPAAFPDGSEGMADRKGEKVSPSHQYLKVAAIEA
jgi:hypothetical protein